MLNTTVEEITETEVVYRLYNEPEGPRYRLSRENVERIQYRNGRIEVFSTPNTEAVKTIEGNYDDTSSAIDDENSQVPSVDANNIQTVFPSGMPIIVKKGDFIINGCKPIESEILVMFGESRFSDYKKATNMYSAGRTLIRIGIPLYVAGDILLLVGVGASYTNYQPIPPKARLALTIVGSIASFSGFTLNAVGIPIMSVGNRRLNNLAEDYNKKGVTSEHSLSLGFTSSGIGFSFLF